MAVVGQALDQRWLRFFNAPVAVPRTPIVVVAALAIGVAFDVALAAGVVGLAGTLCVLLACGALIASGRLRNPHAVALVAIAPVFGIWLTVRSSDWLIPLDVLAVCALVSLGCSLASGGSIWDLTVPRVGMRTLQAIAQTFFAPRFLVGRRDGESPGRVAAVVRGAAIAIPIVAALGALLASADAVFASFIDVDISDGVRHVLWIVAGTLAAAWLFRLASLSPVDVPAMAGPRLGTTECLIVLGALNVLLGAFAAARLVALSEGGSRVLESAGLTYAEYARSGFFQLLAASMIVVISLLALRASADIGESRSRTYFVGLSLGVVVLTLAIVVSAFHRLVLYEDAFGLTMLRLYVQTAIVWVGIVVIMLGIVVARRRGREWLLPGAGAAALVLLLGLNILDPEAFVARHNLSHPAKTETFDSFYLSQLSDDAVPVIESAAQSDDPEAEALRHSICTTSPRPSGWAAFNAARKSAGDVRSRLC